MFFIARSATWQACSKLGLSIIVSTAALLSVVASDVSAKGPAASSPTLASVKNTVTVNELPSQGVKVLGLIYQGGPFPYTKDGTVFGNRERLLPRQPRGFYREYTVKTPGVRHRGARRIVCGGEEVRQPDTCYYTADHYASFRRIVE